MNKEINKSNHPEYTLELVRQAVILHKSAYVGYILRKTKLIKMYVELHNVNHGKASSILLKQKNILELVKQAGTELLNASCKNPYLVNNPFHKKESNETNTDTTPTQQQTWSEQEHLQPLQSAMIKQLFVFPHGEFLATSHMTKPATSKISVMLANGQELTLVVNSSTNLTEGHITIK